MATAAVDQQPTVVEFVGVPGAGKSTLAAELVETLQDDGIPVRTPVSDVNDVKPRSRRVPWKTAYVARYLVSRPIAAASWLQTFRRNPNASGRDVVKTGFNWLFVAGALRTHQGTDAVTVADQGLLQAYWSVVLGDPDPETYEIRRVLETEFSETRLVTVLVEADSDVVRRRLAARVDNPSRVTVDANAEGDPGPAEGEDVTYSLEEALAAYAHVADSLVALEGRYSSLSVFRCRNDEVDDIRRNVTAIRHTVSSDG